MEHFALAIAPGVPRPAWFQRGRPGIERDENEPQSLDAFGDSILLSVSFRRSRRLSSLSIALNSGFCGARCAGPIHFLGLRWAPVIVAEAEGGRRKMTDLSESTLPTKIQLRRDTAMRKRRLADPC